MTPAEGFTQAADIIEKPGAWTQGTCARDVMGFRVLTDDPNATCFCGAGALFKVNAPWDKCTSIYQEYYKTYIAVFNDKVTTRAEDIVKRFRHLATLPEAQV